MEVTVEIEDGQIWRMSGRDDELMADKMEKMVQR